VQHLLLIVDDDTAARRAMDVFFRREGFRTALAADGIEALASAVDRTPDLILLDLSMPRLDGLEFLHALRAVDRLAGVPVLVTSARSDQPAVAATTTLGVATYLVKTTYSLRGLLNIVREQLARRAA